MFNKVKSISASLLTLSLMTSAPVFASEIAEHVEYTQLIRASRSGDINTLRSLPKMKSLVNKVDSHGETPLLNAIWYRHHEAAKLLLNAGASPDHVTTQGVSLLMMAAHNGDTDSVKLLLKAGADKNYINKGGKTAVFFAKEQGHKEIAEIIKSFKS